MLDEENLKNDVINIGKDILGRELTEEEIEECTQAFKEYYEILLEDAEDDEEAALALFDEDFYDKLTEYLED